MTLKYHRVAYCPFSGVPVLDGGSYKELRRNVRLGVTDHCLKNFTVQLER